MTISGSVESPVFTSEAASLNEGSPSLTENDRNVSRQIWERYQKAKNWKMQMGFGEAEENWDFWNGKQWRKRRPRQYTMAVVNQIYETVETILGHLGDSIPEQRVSPRNPEHVEIAQIVTKLLNWSDDVNRLPTEMELPTRSALVSGFGVFRIDWDVTSDRFRGAPAYGHVDEAHFFLSPWARVLDDAEYIIEAKNVPIGYVKKTWEEGSRVPPGVWDGTLTPLGPANTAGIEGHEYQAFNTTDSAYTQISRETRAKSKDKGLCTLIEQWMREEDGDIRYTVIANGVVLQDGPSPYDDGEYPYIVFNAIRAKNSPYGHSLVGFVKGLQRELNEMHSYALDQQRFESDSPLVVSLANINEGQSITNAPGSVYIDADQNRQGYYLLNKPGANPHWLQMQEHVVDRMRSISGNVDILRGERPAGVTTLGGMEIVREAASVLVSKMVRHIVESLRRKGILVVNRMRQFLKDNRTVRIVGQRGMTEFLEVNRPSGFGMTGALEVKDAIPADFEAEVDFTPNPPGGTQAKFERSMALLQAGVVDAQYILEEIGEDQGKVEALVERMTQAAEAAKQQAIAEKTGQPPADDSSTVADALAALSAG